MTNNPTDLSRRDIGSLRKYVEQERHLSNAIFFFFIKNRGEHLPSGDLIPTSHPPSGRKKIEIRRNTIDPQF